jgi:hypothetical protein
VRDRRGTCPWACSRHLRGAVTKDPVGTHPATIFGDQPIDPFYVSHVRAGNVTIFAWRRYTILGSMNPAGKISKHPFVREFALIPATIPSVCVYGIGRNSSLSSTNGPYMPYTPQLSIYLEFGLLIPR